MRLWIFASLFFSLTASAVSMQSNTPAQAPPVASSVEKGLIPAESFIGRSRFSIKTFIEVPSNEMLIAIDEGRSSLDARDKRVQFVPGSTTQMGLRLGYGPFYWTYKTSAFSEDSQHVATYGQSKFSDMEFEYLGRRWGVHLHHQVYEGFYVDLNSSSGLTVNTGTSLTGSSTSARAVVSQSIVQRPDVISRNSEVRLMYNLPIFSPRDSRSLFKNEDLFGLGLHFLADTYINVRDFRGEQPFIPAIYSANFGDAKDLIGLSSGTLGLTVGGRIEWVLSQDSDVYVQMRLGGGLQYQESDYIAKSDTSVYISQATQVRGGYKFTGLRHNWELAFDVNILSSDLEPVSLDFISSRFIASYGYLF